jgi:hypothetical protein
LSIKLSSGRLEPLGNWGRALTEAYKKEMGEY